MKEMNAMALQELLRKEKQISLPWLQMALELSYGEARRLIELLCRRGWLGEETDFGYCVNNQYLLLRRLRREEVDDLISEITDDAVSVLEVLKKNQAKGVDFKPLENKIDGFNDTQAAIDLLMRNDLIYQYEGFYFLRVSARTADVLRIVYRRKRMLGTDDLESLNRLRRLFEPLF